MLKLIVLELGLSQTTLLNIDPKTGAYPKTNRDFIYYQWSYIILGSADGRVDSVVIILIII